MTDKNFEERLREKLHGFNEQPPPDMFSRIEKTLVGQGASVPAASPPKRNSTLMRVWGSVATAAVVALAAFAVIRFAPTSEHKPDIAKELKSNGAAEKIDVAELIADGQRIDRPTNIAEAIIEVIREDQGLAVDKIDPLSGSHGTPGFEAELDDDHMLVNAGAPRQTLPSFAAVRDESTEAALRRKQLERERAIEDYWAEMFREQNRLAVSNKQKGNKLAASLYAGNFGTGSGNKTYNDMGALAASDMMIKNVSMTIPESEVYQGNRPNKSQSTRDNSQFASLKHNMPISGGISVAYPITPRISILSGVNYTYMYSSSKHSIDNMATGVKSLEQHYIGIPLGISYSVYSGRVLDFYVRGGGMIEKGIYAGIKEGVMTNDGSSDEVKSSEKIKGIQPSIDAGIGANIRIAKSVGLYIEPGVAYYFERPDQLASYRTENPTNFTLRVGVRFNLK